MYGLISKNKTPPPWRYRSNKMKWSETVFIPVLMVSCFAGGYFCGLADGRNQAKQRGGGVSVREIKTNSSRRQVIYHGHIPPSVENVQVESGCSAPAAALDLLWKAESSNGTRMSGDSGQAQGHFQQHKSNWTEGCALLGVRWPYPQDTNDLAKSAAIVAANWARYAPQALKDGNLEMLIRSHRLPSCPMREDNSAYVDRVLKGQQ